MINQPVSLGARAARRLKMAIKTKAEYIEDLKAVRPGVWPNWRSDRNMTWTRE